jgi:hypothetical protein
MPSDEELEAMKPTLEALYGPLYGIEPYCAQNWVWPRDFNEPDLDATDDRNCTHRHVGYCPNLFTCKRYPDEWKVVVREKLKTNS